MTHKILIADDEPNIVISLEYLLQREGYAVLVARDGQEALDTIARERPALVLLDAITRLQPGVLNDAGSFQQDSFNPALDGLLDCPHYTRPEVWQGHSVPAPLLSGHHAHIERWRREQSLRLTAQQRPQLLQQARRQGRLTAQDEAFLRTLPAAPDDAGIAGH